MLTRLAVSVLCLALLGREAAYAEPQVQDAPISLPRLRELLDAGRYEEAEVLAREELERVEEAASLDGAVLEAWLGEAMRRGGKQGLDETLLCAQRAVQWAAQLGGDADARTGECWFQLGALHYTRDEYGEARKALERALEIREKTLGTDPSVAMTLIFLASLAWDADKDDARAMELFERARSIQTATLPDSHRDVAWCLEREALVHYALKRFDQAKSLLEPALSIRQRTLPSAHAMLGVTLHNLACVASAQRDWILARDYGEQALAVRLAAYGPTHPNVAETLNQLGHDAEALGDLEASEQFYQRALDIQRESHREDDLTAVLELALARVELSSSRRGAAQVALERTDVALGILRRYDLPDDLFSALTLRASIAAGTGDLARERASLSEARELLDSLQHPELLEPALLRAEALFAARSGDTTSAREHLEKALRLQQEALGPDHADLEEDLYWLACLELQSGDPTAATRTALRANALFVAEWRRTAPGFEEDLLLSLDARSSRALDLALYAASCTGDPELVRRVWSALLASRALGFDEVAMRRALVQASDDEGVQQKAHALAAAQRRLSRLFLRTALGGVGSEEALARARDERRTAERQLALATRHLRTPTPALDPDRVRQALPEASALLSFAFVAGRGESKPSALGLESFLNGWQLIAFVQTRAEAVPRMRPIPGGARIAELAQSLQELARRQSDEDEYRRVAAELYQRLWKPLEPELAGIELVFVVPAGPVHAIDLAALPVGEHDYLVEHGPAFQYLGSERELLEGRPQHSGTGLLALGDPDFGARQEPAPGQALFAELTGTRAEIEDVARRFEAASPDEAVTLLSGSGAAEAVFVAKASGQRMLHLATHGFGLDLESAGLTAARGIGGTAPDSGLTHLPSASGDALLACGLALTGANLGVTDTAASEDGILTAEEVGTLDLTGVEWVVLSSCESGRGVLRSSASREGLLGLRRAFHLAGASTVIASLWPVDDRVAGEWMEELYRARLGEGRAAPAAVRAASLMLLERRRHAGTSTHPRNWGGFLSSGDWH